MPVVEASTDTVRKDLTSAPPDGFVVLRPLPYGDVLTRRENAMKWSLNTAENGKQNDAIDARFLQRVTRAFEFAHMIVEHNLLKKDNTPFDFRKPADFVKLDPKVGAEIEKFIDEVNGEDEDDASLSQPSSSSVPNESDS